MALRNAFDALATETTLRRLYNSLNFARDALDRMRVVVDGGGIEVRGINFGWHGGHPFWYGSGSPNSMDAREVQRAQMRSNAINVRNNRWTFT